MEDDDAHKIMDALYGYGSDKLISNATVRGRLNMFSYEVDWGQMYITMDRNRLRFERFNLILSSGRLVATRRSEDICIRASEETLIEARLRGII